MSKYRRLRGFFGGSGKSHTSAKPAPRLTRSSRGPAWLEQLESRVVLSSAPVLEPIGNLASNEGDSVNVSFDFTDDVETTAGGSLGLDPADPALPVGTLDFTASANISIDTTAGTFVSGATTLVGTPVTRDGHTVMAFAFNNFTLPAGLTLTAIGQYPVAILAQQDIVINGTVDLRPQFLASVLAWNSHTPGAGGGEGGAWSPSTLITLLPGQPAAGAPASSGGQIQVMEGGGGGAHGGAGGMGSIDNDPAAPDIQALGGVVFGDLLNGVIHGGSGGGGGQHFTSHASPSPGTMAEGGDGGGGIELAALGDILVGATGAIFVDGANGEAYAASNAAGGGGAGGGILIHGEDVVVNGTLSANGGAGGNDLGSGGGGGGGRILVAEQAGGATSQPTIAIGAAITANGGAATPSGTAGAAGVLVLNHTIASAPVPETYSFYIDWGNGQIDVGAHGDLDSFIPGTPSVDAEGTFSGATIYADEGVFNVIVRLADSSMSGNFAGVAGVDFVQQSFQVSVANVAPALALSPIATVDEGGVAVLDLSFTDPGVADTHTVTVNWGDGTTVAYPAITVGNRTAQYSHQYEDDPDGAPSDYTVTVTIDDGDTGSDVAQTLATVNNLPPSVTVDAPAVTVGEGTTAANGGALADVIGDVITLTASLGVVVDNGDGTWSWSYATTDGPNDSATVTITATDDDGQSSSVDFALTVNNLAPIVAASLPAVIVDEGTTANNSGSYFDVPADTVTLTASIGTISYAGGAWTWSYAAEDDLAVQTVTITATDEDGDASTASFQLTVNNVAPTASVVTPIVTVDEGTTASNSGSYFDVPADTVTLTASIGNISYAGGAWSWSYDATDDLVAQTVTITATDEDGGVNDTTTFQLNVLNVEPTITSLSLATGSVCTPLLGQAVTLTGLFVDPGADTHSAVIDWGDGQFTTLTSADIGQLASGVTHAYDSLGSQAITVTVTDDDGGSNTSTLATFVAGVKLNTSTGVLEIAGTDCDDCVEVHKVSSSTMKVVYKLGNSLKTSATFSSAAVSKISMDLRAGDDWGFISQNLAKPSLMFGGDGNDKLTGGNGHDVLVGGPGSDLLIGRQGNDILIGGAGLDLLIGESGSDIVIAGSTSYDADAEALDAIMAEWSSSHSYEQRVANVTDALNKTSDRLNGESYFTNENVYDDGVFDFLLGGGGKDLFFANEECSWSSDWIGDLQNNEFVEQLSDEI